MVALDTNLLLEILERRHHLSQVLQVFEKYSKQDAVLGISTLSISNTFYLAEKHKIAVKRVETLLKDYKVFSVIPEDIDWALAHYHGKDFEDALQIAAALREKCTAFLTLDASLAKKYNKFLDIELVR